MKMTMLFWIALAGIVALIYPFFVVHRQLLGHHEPIEKSPALWGADFKKISFACDDGSLLKGWWIRGKGERAVMLLHGKAGSRNGYHSGVFELGEWYWRRGYHVMMVDMRAHGKSDGKYTTFGYKEHKELLDWLKQVDPFHRFRWHLHGFSMGAATALMMMARDPEYIERVVADAPWIDFEHLVRRELVKRAWLPPFCYPYVRFIAETFFGQNFRFIDNRKRVKALCGKPIFYIFESEDKLIDAHHLSALRHRCPKVSIKLFEGAHVEAFKNDPQSYTTKLAEEGF